MSKIEKSAAASMSHIQTCRTAAVRLKGEAEKLAYANVPAGPQRDTLLAISARAGATIDAMNGSENELAQLVQQIRKQEATTAGAKA